MRKKIAVLAGLVGALLIVLTMVSVPQSEAQGISPCVLQCVDDARAACDSLRGRDRGACRAFAMCDCVLTECGLEDAVVGCPNPPPG